MNTRKRLQDITPLRALSLGLLAGAVLACSNGPALCGDCPAGSHCEFTRCVVDDLPAGSTSSSSSSGSSGATSEARASGSASSGTSTGVSAVSVGSSSALGVSASAGVENPSSAHAASSSGFSATSASSGTAASGTQGASSSQAAPSSAGVPLVLKGGFVGGVTSPGPGALRVQGRFLAGPRVDVTSGGLRLQGGFP